MEKITKDTVAKDNKGKSINPEWCDICKKKCKQPFGKIVKCPHFEPKLAKDAKEIRKIKIK